MSLLKKYYYSFLKSGNKILYNYVFVFPIIKIMSYPTKNTLKGECMDNIITYLSLPPIYIKKDFITI